MTRTPGWPQTPIADKLIREARCLAPKHASVTTQRYLGIHCASPAPRSDGDSVVAFPERSTRLRTTLALPGGESSVIRIAVPSSDQTRGVLPARAPRAKNRDGPPIGDMDLTQAPMEDPHVLS